MKVIFLHHQPYVVSRIKPTDIACEILHPEEHRRSLSLSSPSSHMSLLHTANLHIDSLPNFRTNRLQDFSGARLSLRHRRIEESTSKLFLRTIRHDILSRFLTEVPIVTSACRAFAWYGKNLSFTRWIFEIYLEFEKCKVEFWKSKNFSSQSHSVLWRIFRSSQPRQSYLTSTCTRRQVCCGSGLFHLAVMP